MRGLLLASIGAIGVGIAAVAAVFVASALYNPLSNDVDVNRDGNVTAADLGLVACQFGVVPATPITCQQRQVNETATTLARSATPTYTPTATPTPGPTSLFGNGSDGPVTFATSTVFMPPVDAVVDAGSAGSSTLIVSAPSGVFQPGQKILIHQSRGAGAGNWEVNAVQAYALGNLSTLTPLQHSYASSGGADRAQVLVVPQYTNVTVNAGVTVRGKSWNGSTGGVLAMFANGTVTISGTIDAGASGFRGGAGSVNGNGQQGEGTGGPGTHDIANNGNGGGSSSSTLSDNGAGGGNGTAGTDGNGQEVPVGGSTSGDATLATATFGGGGGGGSNNDRTGANGPGGAGGGLLFLAGASFNLTGVISSSGEAGHAGGPRAGGGGAGGSILIRGQNLTFGTGNITATGGAGAFGSDANSGSGGVGRIRTEYCSSISGGIANPPASVQQISC